MRTFRFSFLLLILLSIASTQVFAETLVGLDDNGNIKAGAAISWEEESVDSVIFFLGEGNSAESISTVLKEKLAGAKVEVLSESQLKISGIPASELYPRLGFIELGQAASTQIDLNVLALDIQTEAMKTDAMPATPDGSSSIRASETLEVKLDMGPEDLRFAGKVVKLMREEKFPFAEITVEITKAPTSKLFPHSELEVGKSYLMRPFFSIKYPKGKGDVTLDWSNSETMMNSNVWHLKPGDIVQGELSSPNRDGFNARYIVKK